MPSSPQTVATVVVFDYEYGPDGLALNNAEILVWLNYDLGVMPSPIVNVESKKLRVTTDANGYWQLNLVPNPNINPLNTVYNVKTPFRTYQISVPAGAGPYQSSAIASGVTPSLSPSGANLLGPLTITGALTVTGLITAQAGLTITGGALSIVAPLNVAGAFATTGGAGTGTFSQALTVQAGGAAITGNSTIAGTLGVIGNTTLTGSLTVSSITTIQAGGLTVSAGGMTVTGASSITGTLSVSGLLTASAGLTVSGGTLTAGALTATGTITLPDQSLNFRTLQLQNAVTRARSHQATFGTIAITAGTWATYGASLTITPAVASHIMVWASFSGSHSVTTTDYFRARFNGVAGDMAASGISVRDDVNGLHGGFLVDTFTQGGQGAVVIQMQMTTDNTGTFTPSAGLSAALEILALAIPTI